MALFFGSLVAQTVLNWKYLFIRSSCQHFFLISLICIHVCHTHLHNLSILSCYSCTAALPELYSTSIVLFGWFVSWRALLQWPRPCIELLRYMILFNWLYRFNIMWLVINSFRADTHTHTHTHTHIATDFANKAILRN